MQTVIDRAIQHVHSRVQVSPRANGNDRMTFTGSNSNSSILLHPTSIVVVPTKSFDGFIDTDLPISPKGPRYEDCHYSYTTHKEGNCLDLHLPSKHSMKPVTLSLAKPADITLKPLKKPIKKEASWRKRCGTYLKNMYSHIHVMSPGKESNGSPKFLPRYLHNRPPGVCMYDLSELHDPKGLSRIACSTHPPGFMFGSVDAYVTENTGSSNDQGSFGIIRDYTEYGPNDSSFLSSGTSMSSRCSLDYNYGNKKCFLKVSGSMDEDKEIIYMEGPISGNIDSIVNMLPPIASVLTTPPLPKRMKSSNSVNELAVVDKPTSELIFLYLRLCSYLGFEIDIGQISPFYDVLDVGMPIPSKERQFSNTLTKQEFVFSKELNMIDHGGIPCSLTSHLQAVICLTKARFKGTDTSVQILLSFDEKMLQPTSRHVSYPLTVSFVILATLERLSTQWGKITVFVSAKESAAARARFGTL